MDELSDYTYWEIHGMVGAPNFQVLVSSSANGNYNKKSICRDLAARLEENASKQQKDAIVFSSKVDGFREASRNLNTNSNLRILNGGGPNNVGEDKGYGCHIETAQMLRTGRRMDNFREVLYKSIGEAMEEYYKTPIKDRKVLSKTEGEDDEIELIDENSCLTDMDMIENVEDL